MITTGRYASEKTRKLAERLAGRLGTFYTGRGKKTIDSLAEYARRKGEEEIAVVEGNQVAVIEISATGWKWLKKVSLDDYEKQHRS